MNKKTVFAILILVVFLLPAAAPANAIIGATNVNSNFNSTATFMGTVQNIANFIIAFITILGIIFLVAGPVMAALAGPGDEKAAERAKNTVTYALIGLFIAAAAYVLERLVLTQFVG